MLIPPSAGGLVNGVLERIALLDAHHSGVLGYGHWVKHLVSCCESALLHATVRLLGLCAFLNSSLPLTGSGGMAALDIFHHLVGVFVPLRVQLHGPVALGQQGALFSVLFVVVPLADRVAPHRCSPTWLLPLHGEWHT